VGAARTGFRDELAFVVTKFAQLGISGAGTLSVSGLGIAVIKTAAAIFMVAVVAIAAVASGIIGLAGLAVYQLVRK
jgi:hypothetical protein